MSPEVKELVATLKMVYDEMRGKTIHLNEYDYVGEHSCCGKLSYELHSSDCWLMKVKAQIEKYKGDNHA